MMEAIAAKERKEHKTKLAVQEKTSLRSLCSFVAQLPVRTSLLSSPRPAFRPRPKRVVAAAVVVAQNLIHDPCGPRGRLAGAWTFTTTMQFIDDALNQRLLDVRRIG